LYNGILVEFLNPSTQCVCACVRARAEICIGKCFMINVAGAWSWPLTSIYCWC